MTNESEVWRMSTEPTLIPGKELLGQRVWFPDDGEGTLSGAGGDDGRLDVLITKNAASGRPQLFSAYAEHVLVLVEDTSAPADTAQSAEAPRKKRFGVF